MNYARDPEQRGCALLEEIGGALIGIGAVLGGR
jgi:hypothetical protein